MDPYCTFEFRDSLDLFQRSNSVRLLRTGLITYSSTKRKCSPKYTELSVEIFFHQLIYIRDLNRNLACSDAIFFVLGKPFIHGLMFGLKLFLFLFF